MNPARLFCPFPLLQTYLYINFFIIFICMMSSKVPSIFRQGESKETNLKIKSLSAVWDMIHKTFNAHVYICQISYLLRNSVTWNLNHNSHQTGSYNFQTLVWLPQRTFTIFRWQCGAIFRYCCHHFVLISLLLQNMPSCLDISSTAVWLDTVLHMCVLGLRENPRFIACFILTQTSNS